MKDHIVRPTVKFSGTPEIPGDKSISHRALIFAALADGVTVIEGLLESADTQSTFHCLQQMGIQIQKKGTRTEVQGQGLYGLKSPIKILDCGNSGTTIRLLMGLLAGQKDFSAELTGDLSLQRRPMKRVAEPLIKMGAQLQLTQQDFAPLKVQGASLHGIDYELKIASAQIKTAIILAALTSEGRTRLTGEIHSRDHTEKMLKFFGVKIKCTSTEIELVGGQSLQSQKLKIPGDPSTAAFWLAGACLIPNSKIEMHQICLNPSRLGFIRILQKMGAVIEIEKTGDHPEPVGNLKIRGVPLKGVRIEASEVPSMIDELPILAILATQAEGVTEVLGAEELRVKETDRIEAVALNLRAMGAKIETRPDGFIIQGVQKLRGATIQSFHDHRIAMAFSMAALIADGPSLIQDADCVGISYPEFFETLKTLTSEVLTKDEIYGRK